MEKMRYILGSGSPRRKELLGMILPEFTVRPSRFDESGLMTAGLSAEETVKTLSRCKAADVYNTVCKEYTESNIPFCVIGGDTVVVSPDGEIMGKPADRADGARMLRSLSGATHAVITAVAVLAKTETGEKERVFAVSTRVTFYPLTDREIERYLDSGEPFDKAGGYGIQGLGGILVEKIDGDYNNVVGLPLSRLVRELREMDLI
jgi:septum formation protein